MLGYEPFVVHRNEVVRRDLQQLARLVVRSTVDMFEVRRNPRRDDLRNRSASARGAHSASTYLMHFVHDLGPMSHPFA